MKGDFAALDPELASGSSGRAVIKQLVLVSEAGRAQDAGGDPVSHQGSHQGSE